MINIDTVIGIATGFVVGGLSVYFLREIRAEKSYWKMWEQKNYWFDRYHDFAERAALRDKNDVKTGNDNE